MTVQQAKPTFMPSIRATSATVGQLRVSGLQCVASSLLPRAMLAFTQKSPDTLVEVYEGPNNDPTARLRSGGLDLVVGLLGKPDTLVGLSFQRLFSEEVVVVANMSSPAVGVTKLPDLDAFRVLYLPKDSAIRPLVARLLISQGVALFRNRIETASPAFERAVTLADPSSVWIISKGVVAGYIAQGQLAHLKVDTAVTLGVVGIMSRAEEIPFVATRSFAKILSELF